MWHDTAELFKEMLTGFELALWPEDVKGSKIVVS